MSITVAMKVRSGWTIADIPHDLSGLGKNRWWEEVHIRPCEAEPLRTKTEMDYWEIEYLKQKAKELGMTGKPQPERSFYFGVEFIDNK